MYTYTQTLWELARVVRMPLPSPRRERNLQDNLTFSSKRILILLPHQASIESIYHVVPCVRRPHRPDEWRSRVIHVRYSPSSMLPIVLKY